MTWPKIPAPPRQAAWLYAGFCLAPYAALAAAYSPLSNCGFLCMLGPMLMLGALALAALLFLAGLLLRRAQQGHGQASPAVNWGLVSQGLLVLFGCGELLYLVLGF